MKGLEWKYAEIEVAGNSAVDFGIGSIESTARKQAFGRMMVPVECVLTIDCPLLLQSMVPWRLWSSACPFIPQAHYQTVQAGVSLHPSLLLFRPQKVYFLFLSLLTYAVFQWLAIHWLEPCLLSCLILFPRRQITLQRVSSRHPENQEEASDTK